MKNHQMTLHFASVLFALSTFGQSTLLIDQQSLHNSGENAGNLVAGQTLGQSFTPTLSSIDFVSFLFFDGNSINAQGATVYVKLFSGNITNGTLLGATAPISLPNGLGQSGNALTTLLFSNSISLVAGSVYYLQPLLQSGDSSFNVAVDNSFFNYTGGTAYYQGTAIARAALVFNEGIIVVPEPSSFALLVLGGAGLCFGWRIRSRKIQPTA